jgi:hypothetical protein
MDTPRGNAIRKRTRTRKACIPCGERKRKCDGQHPCSQCHNHGYCCNYRDGQSSSTPVASASGRAQAPIRRPAPSAYAIPVTNNFGAGQSSREHDRDRSDPDETSLQSSHPQYFGRASGQTFHTYVGQQLQPEAVPLSTPITWNLRRKELPPCGVRPMICSLLTLDVAREGVITFFRLQFPACDFLEQQRLLDRCVDHWLGNRQKLSFEALISLIVGLASMFSQFALSQEADLFDHAKNILGDVAIMRQPTVEILAATVLYYIYLRANDEPHACWMVTCSAMHTAEALGLHRDNGSTTGALGTEETDWSPEHLSILFWMTCAANRLFSHELGRSPIILQGANRPFPFRASDMSASASMCKLGFFLPLKLNEDCTEADSFQFAETLNQIQVGPPNEQHLLKLIAAEVTFCLYRNCRVNGMGTTPQLCEQTLSIGKAAIETVKSLAQIKRPWWNALNAIFQFTCVLSAMNTLESLAILPETIEAIKLIQENFESKAAAELLKTARLLIGAVRSRKEKEIAVLTIGLQEVPDFTSLSDISDMPDLTAFDDPFNLFGAYLGWNPGEISAANYSMPPT